MTPQQKRTLDFVREFYAENGRSPTQRAIMTHLGLASPGTVNRQMIALEEYGFLRRTGDFSGNYVPIDSDALELARIPTADLVAELDRREIERVNRETAS